MTYDTPALESKICRGCVLPDTFPGIQFDHSGVCQYCRTPVSRDDQETKAKYNQRFHTLLATQVQSESSYDVLVAYSGGKDSTFTLDLLKMGRVGVVPGQWHSFKIRSHSFKELQWGSYLRCCRCLFFLLFCRAPFGFGFHGFTCV